MNILKDLLYFTPQEPIQVV